MKMLLMNKFIMPKKKIKVFNEYYEAILYCILHNVEYKRISKHHTRLNTSRDWFVVQRNRKVLKNV
jgi:hypothetical protein